MARKHSRGQVVPFGPGVDPSDGREGARVIRSAVANAMALARRMGLSNAAMALDLALTAVDVDLDCLRRHETARRLAAE